MVFLPKSVLDSEFYSDLRFLLVLFDCDKGAKVVVIASISLQLRWWFKCHVKHKFTKP